MLKNREKKKKKRIWGICKVEILDITEKSPQEESTTVVFLRPEARSEVLVSCSPRLCSVMASKNEEPGLLTLKFIFILILPFHVN